MRVNVRVDTTVSLSDFGSSVWGGSDDEGTVASVSDQSAQSRRSGRGRTRGALTSLSSGSYETPPGSRDVGHASSPSTSRLGLRHGLSPLSRSWGEANCSKWVTAGSKQGSGETAYSDALTDLGALSLSRSNRTDDWSDSEAESEGSTNTRGPGVKGMVTRRTMVALEDGTSVHHGVRCSACQMTPIVGNRYHCASCVQGADFCADCERTGYAIRADVGHQPSHLVIRLAAPLDSSQAVEALGAVLSEAQKRLHKQVPMCSHRIPPHSPSALVQTTNTTIYSNKAVKCSFCISPILQGPRFLCANCPLASPTSSDGFNLCATCHGYSLQCHDPLHFFIKVNPMPREMNSRSRIPLGERWEVREVTKGGPLLPMLYANVEQRDPLRPLPHGSRADASAARNLSVRLGDGMAVVDNGNGQVVNFGNGKLEVHSQDGHSIHFGSWGQRTNGAEARRRAQEIEMTALRESQARHLVPLERLVHPWVAALPIAAGGC